ncbi:MAG: hypothetical protein HC907_35965 [Richelia sp. SM1_7_0]|nr:hypothetical protein [Richelia sp. SM1_7_0]
MNVGFRKSFEKDLSKIRDETWLQKIQTVIEEVENAESLLELFYLLRISPKDNS